MAEKQADETGAALDEVINRAIAKYASALARKGGVARAKALTAERRRAIARMGGKAKVRNQAKRAKKKRTL